MGFKVWWVSLGEFLFEQGGFVPGFRNSLWVWRPWSFASLSLGFAYPAKHAFY